MPMGMRRGLQEMFSGVAETIDPPHRKVNCKDRHESFRRLLSLKPEEAGYLSV